jgi:signal transduction histidine kinase
MLKNATSKVVNDIDIGYWELKNGELYWSEAFLSVLGYSEKNAKISLDFFLSNLIHKEDSKQFRNNFFGLIKNNTNFRQSMLIKTKKGNYKEFVCTTNYNLSLKLEKDSKLIFFNKRKLKTNKKVKKDKFYFKQATEMTRTGSWYVDFIKQKSYWDQQSRRILEYPEDYIPSLKNSEKYYSEEHKRLARKTFIKCAVYGKAFNIELKMLTMNNREFWVKAMGKPVYNTKRDIVGIRGVFQDIDAAKTKELNLLKTSNIIASQNKRLFNFAHIVSHNLRSHSSNLTLVSQLIDSFDSPDEKLELLDNVKDIAESLNDTIEHLNEVVTIQTSINKIKSEVKFSTALKQVLSSINQIMIREKAVVNTDFSKVEAINYIPAYMESIMLNLITNAIKYKHPDRSPIINIRTYTKNAKPVLEISDNGLGIDMDKFGDNLFGMYKTFHYNSDAVGIGLFITKNQIEALHGDIKVESEVNKGTLFRIFF